MSIVNNLLVSKRIKKLRHGTEKLDDTQKRKEMEEKCSDYTVKHESNIVDV